MKKEDIDRIETTLSVQLPESYRTVLINYPFPGTSFGYTCMLINNAVALISMNQGPSLHAMLHNKKEGETPKESHFLIGNDGGEEEYYLDLESQQNAIFKFDLETGEIEEYAENFEAYILKIQEIDKEIEEDERRMEEIR